MPRGDRLRDVDRQECRLAAHPRGGGDRFHEGLAVGWADDHEGVDRLIAHHLADLVGAELGDLHLVGIDAGLLQDDAEQRGVDLGAADHADATAGQILDRLDPGLGLFPGRLGRRPRGRPQHHHVLAHDGDRGGPLGHVLVGAADREIRLARGERGEAVDRTCRGDHGEANRGAFSGEVLRHRLDQLQVVTAGRTDRDPQRGRAQHDEGGADGGCKEQQPGGEHQERGAFPSAARGAG